MFATEKSAGTMKFLMRKVHILKSSGFLIKWRNDKARNQFFSRLLLSEDNANFSDYFLCFYISFQRSVANQYSFSVVGQKVTFQNLKWKHQKCHLKVFILFILFRYKSCCLTANEPFPTILSRRKSTQTLTAKATFSFIIYWCYIYLSLYIYIWLE